MDYFGDIPSEVLLRAETMYLEHVQTKRPMGLT